MDKIEVYELTATLRGGGVDFRRYFTSEMNAMIAVTKLLDKQKRWERTDIGNLICEEGMFTYLIMPINVEN